MRRVLVVAYDFPPVGGAGVQRSVKFVRYLPDHGFECVVVTGPGETGSRWTPLDETLVSEVGSAPVHRVPGPEPREPTGLHRRVRRLLGRSAFGRWWVDGVGQAGREVGDVDLVYASLGPYESGAAAAALADALGRPWVADLRDPWALDEMLVYPSGAHRAQAARTMRSTLASAAGIIMNTPEATARLLQAFPELAHKTLATIPNGYDAADFAGPVPSRDDDSFRIVHTGYLHTALGRRHERTRALRRLLGGARPGVDIVTRSHLFLLEAIEALRREEPALGHRIELHLAGVLSAADRSSGSSDVVHVHGYLPHLESVALLRTADMLFLPMQNLPRGHRATIVPGKTYEYLAAGRRILAAVPDGDAHDLLVESGGAVLCRPDAVACMTAALREEVRRWRDGDARPLPAAAVVKRYERTLLTERLAAVFEEVLSP